LRLTVFNGFGKIFWSANRFHLLGFEKIKDGGKIQDGGLLIVLGFPQLLWKGLLKCYRNLNVKIRPFFKMAEKFNMAARFFCTVNRSVCVRFRHVNTFLALSYQNIGFQDVGNFQNGDCQF
jgi:hypothetical protein